ncbi:MAG: anhydro-N-acetylmuramic acid kinase [Sneathiella sp.]
MGKHGQKEIWAVGLISGTSMDGVDAALIKTDGGRISEFGPALSIPYETEFRNRFRPYLRQRSAPMEIIEEFTRLNADAVLTLVENSAVTISDIEVIGFHGQTLFHDAPNGVTVQIGNGQLLSDLTGIDVVADFRSNDVAAGGEGAPFAPLYHQALAADLARPLMVLNLGGVANVTYISDDTILAFDTGPASAMIDDWVLEKAGVAYDDDGKIAAKGTVHTEVLSVLLENDYFDKTPPKSLDRDDFSAAPVRSLSLEDGAATLTAFTVKSIVKSLEHCPGTPLRWLVTGGGRKNSSLMKGIAAEVGVPVEPVETVGWRGDELEAEAFAFLAVRSLFDQPLSLPTTTGVREAMTGGVLFKTSKQQAVNQ